jgi:hypothetical protein
MGRVVEEFGGEDGVSNQEGEEEMLMAPSLVKKLW